jgi:uncharacterized protein (TIGR03437 family)
MWASETHTCPLLLAGTRPATIAQLACRDRSAKGAFKTVITEGDPRLAGTRLAIPVTATNVNGRYLTSMVRPEAQNLYFTSVSGGTLPAFSNQIAWRYRDYTLLERVAGAGDQVSLRLQSGGTQTVTLSAAGPIDADPNGREFVYLEAAAFNIFGIFEVKAGGVFDAIYQARLSETMRDTPWGMGGFVFNDGGMVFRQAGILFQLDTITKGISYSYVAIEGVKEQPFMPPSVLYPNLQLTQFFRPVNDPSTFIFNWGSGAAVPGQTVPPALSSIWKDWTEAPYYVNQLGTPNATTAATFAVADRVAVMGTGSLGSGTADYDPRITVSWPISSLWLNRAGNWVKFLKDAELPDNATGPKKMYQGVAASTCQLEFATKRYDQSFDNGGQFYGFYRLYRPCINSASFDTSTRELVITGLNLQDRTTEIGVPNANAASGAPQGQLLAARILSVTPTEVHAFLDSIQTLDTIAVLINGQVWSDPAKVVVTAQPAPILRTMLDLNDGGTPAAPNKIMVLKGLFGCVTASAQTVNYPDTLGNCSVQLENPVAASAFSRRLALLYASNDQINFLFPADLPTFAYHLRVTRSDANGVFSSGEYITNTSPNSPIAIQTLPSRNTIVVVIRSGQVVVLGPTDPIQQGEWFTIYLTGLDLSTLGPGSVQVGPVDAQYAAAVVNWAQGVVQVNILAPSSRLGDVQVKAGATPAFPVRIN